MKNQTLSIEQMKHLKYLGVDVSKASMCWIDGTFIVPFERTIEQVFVNANVSFDNEHKYVSTFTLQDTLELLPINVRLCKNYLTSYETDYWICNIMERDDITVNADGGTALEAAYKMICWCAENNYLTHIATYPLSSSS